MASVQLLSAVEVLTPTNEEGEVVAIDWSTGLVPFSSKIWLAARTRRGSRVDRLPLLPEAFRDKGKGRGGSGASCREEEAKFIRASSTTSEQIFRTLDLNIVEDTYSPRFASRSPSCLCGSQQLYVR